MPFRTEPGLWNAYSFARRREKRVKHAKLKLSGGKPNANSINGITINRARQRKEFHSIVSEQIDSQGIVTHGFKQPALGIERVHYRSGTGKDCFFLSGNGLFA